uniref:Zinc carboxypeptidase A 1 n=1 Tax=Timema shepardi TaxID=629360 RepID=A0A7R9AKZ6_TIMSH|nr:unnamed protein product [Timema shepardi]
MKERQSLAYKMWACNLFLLALALGVALAGKARFDNYVVYRVVPTTQDQVDALRDIEDQPDGLNFWAGPTQPNGTVDVMVPPHKIADFEDMMNIINANYVVFIEDVQKLVDSERPSVEARSASFGWNDYYRIDQVMIISIKMLRVYSPRCAGIHAREWIAPATLTFIINQLLTSTNTAIRNVAENFDWYIVPSANPDGYEYSHTNDRMWRKTRSPSNILCRGADPNRNWGFQWNTGGSSSLACSDTFHGSSAFSEIETRTLSEYITTIASKLKVYVSIHSYMQMLLLPYGFTRTRVSNYNSLLDIGQKSIASLASRYGTQYSVGNVVDLLYVASGSSVDWVMGVHGISNAFIYELRDTGRNGFVLPASEIIPTGQETLDALITLVIESRKTF